MKIYNFDNMTKKLIGSKDTVIDPLEKIKNNQEIYLLPANATFKAPPEHKEGKEIFFNGSD